MDSKEELTRLAGREPAFEGLSFLKAIRSTNASFDVSDTKSDLKENADLTNLLRKSPERVDNKYTILRDFSSGVDKKSN